MRPFGSWLLPGLTALAVLVPVPVASERAPEPPAGATPSIIDGGPATEDYPWMSALLGPGGGQFCGAALIKPQWVLTATHCIQGDTRITVRVGSRYHDSGGEVAAAASFVTGSADLSLIKLDRPVSAAPLSLVDAAPVPGAAVRILGWGAICGSHGDPACYPRDLRELDSTIAEDGRCRTLDSRYELCVAAAGGRGACYGDSGGPVLSKNGAAWRLVGSASRLGGQGCGGSVIYSDAAAQREFIERFTRI